MHIHTVSPIHDCLHPDDMTRMHQLGLASHSHTAVHPLATLRTPVAIQIGSAAHLDPDSAS